MAQDISSQILKGILQGVMLLILEQQPEYGYGLSTKLNHYGLDKIPKGTIYPLLTTMEKRGLIIGKIQPSPAGPDRKYYFITPAGTAAKNEFANEWRQLENVVNQLLDEELKQ
ncbi:MAG: PadR family transcriptional regulator [Liquorilactobacillus nagelii]|jgi:PadR family transcriptional regulator PadR|uniref:PadR family transcriptional regulator n=1 Tax=Liquorilactobacillus nagelii TaxID=82688 RepID=A0A3S6QU98_9LACO|nr:PadR family transcriptional regulator [Liquorilactobacillus nagelii]AUJ31702.1 PadR family transcriptional regulator [Liquorilactobacillus nagelii]KRL40420.1 PadR family transcriptional regulator [Liquorilactobacillus nagelii DSM 13675]MCC7615929.1 PadR family transcriptional regulator [Liquorilactobacillus nagelii]MCI1920978.1 PadR family transcriptional regulator [Liquorilactobacillus nagelii]MCI1975829.1 PadR family transcriptional regulator [Liquorilactobacillus nagelii]